MQPFFIYLIKANVALALFYGLYVILLKKDTFLHMRRFFFLSVILFSLLYPFFAIPALNDVFTFRPAPEQTQATVWVESPTMGVMVEDAEVSWLSLHWAHLLSAFIFGGIMLFALRFLWQLFSIFHIRAKSEKQIVSGVPIYHLADAITPFSFFRWIFIHTENHSSGELSRILLHEQIHARQYHSMDMVLSEFLCIVFWWNPFAWLLKREITMNLEYLADNGVLREGVNSKEYQYHLLKLTYPETAVQLVNNFNVSQLKQRIMMMNKTKSSGRKLAKYVLILPLAFLMITVNSCMNKEKKSEENTETVVGETPVEELAETAEAPSVPEDDSEVFVVVENQPLFPGGNEVMMKFLSDNIKYPVEAQGKNQQGRVITNFVVEKDGRITDVQVVRGVSPLLDKEAVRVIQSMPNWTPGKQGGEEVRVRFTLPVVFRLQGKDAKTSQVPPPPPPPRPTLDSKTSQVPPPPPPPPAAYTKSADELKSTNEVFVVVENQPEFSGGNAAMMKFLSDNIDYPKVAQENGIQGRVICNFVVEKDGSLSDVKVVRGVDTSLNEEAVRVIKSMPNWKPGTQRGQAVRVRFTLPVVFRLQN